MAKSLLWITNNDDLANTEVRIFDTSDQSKADVQNVVWSYVGDYYNFIVITGLGVEKFVQSAWRFSYWDKLTKNLNAVYFMDWTGPVTPKELETLLNDDTRTPVAGPYITADMGQWKVVQETKWSGEDGREVTREEKVRYQFRITCDLDATWYFENVMPTGDPTTKTDDLARGAAVLNINPGTGFIGAIDPLYDPNNFYVAELKSPDGQNANLIKIDSYEDFDYSTLRQSVAPVNLRVKEFAVYSNNPNQLLEPFVFDRKTALGKQYQKVIAPIISPYQSQRYVKTPDLSGYVVDGFTKLNYKILANTSVRIIMDYSEDIPMEGVKNSGSKKYRFAGSKLDEYTNQAGAMEMYNEEDGEPIIDKNLDIPIKVKDDDLKNPLNRSWVRDMETRECPALNRIREQIENRYSSLTSGTNQSYRKYLGERLRFLELLMDKKQCGSQITEQITTIQGVAELYSDPYSETDYSPEVKGEGLWLPTDNFSALRTMDDDAKRLIEDIDFPIDNT